MNRGEVHVYHADLRIAPEEIARLWQILSDDERQRANAFKFEKHQRRFIAGRGFLRLILGSYLGVDAGRLNFNYGSKGKPALDGQIEFNTSHSEELAIYAFTLDTPVGVDVEWIYRKTDLDAIAKSFFSPAECKAYTEFAAEDKVEAFFRCWTRKEAFIKAIGDGLSYPLQSFDVSLGQSAELLRLNASAGRAYEWSMYHLSPADGYVGALAMRGRNLTVRIVSDEWKSSASVFPRIST
jgi:4'-phosphopantetheinyl transferase